MKDITDLRTKQIRIFPIDTLPFAAMRTGVGRRALGAAFHVASVGEDGGDIVFQHGAYKSSDDAEIIVFDSIQINDRRLIIDTNGGSSVAGKLYEDIKAFVHSSYGDSEPALRWRDTEPIVLTEETSCVATLDIDWPSLYSPILMSFVREQAIAASAQASVFPEVTGFRALFRFSYNTPDSLQRHSITLAQKELVIEERRTVPLGERRFFTVSPTPSDVHFQLLGQLEALLSK